MNRQVWVVAGAMVGIVVVAGTAVVMSGGGDGPARRQRTAADAAGAAGTSGVARTAAISGPTRLVSYQGYRARVPASWPVYDLSKDPSQCVRFDQHAVYLGTPGQDQHCPAHIVGRTEALLVQPLVTGQSHSTSSEGVLHADLPAARVSVTAPFRTDRTLASTFTAPAPPTATPPAGATGQPGGTTASPASPAATPSPDLTPSASAGGGPTASAGATPDGSVEPRSSATPAPTAAGGPSASASSTPTGSAPGTPSASAGSPAPVVADSESNTLAPPPDGSSVLPRASSTPTGSSTVTHTLPATPTAGATRTPPFPVPPELITSTGVRGFDTCAAPSAGAMAAWATTYQVVGVYVGGENRSCADGNLSAAWLKTVQDDGYSFLPIYVGLQAPCNTRSTLAKIDPSQPFAQGRTAADNAVGDMQRFELGPGNVVYLDMEFYPSTSASCTMAVIQFVMGWTQRLHQLGYAAGVYGNATSVAQDMVAANESYTSVLPDALWFARWNGTANVDATPYVPDSMWVNRRAKQYQGGHDETHGGVTINIDNDYVQGVVARPVF